MEKVLIINGNPNLNSFSSKIISLIKNELNKKYLISIIDLAKLKFDLILHKGYNSNQELELDLIKAQEKIKQANKIILVYPTWWGNMPALLKGFIDRTFLPGFAFKYGPYGIPKQFLKHKKAVIITTTGGSKIVYALLGHPGNKSLKRFVMNFCGILKVKTYIFSNVRKLNDKRLNKIAKKIKKIAKKI